MTAKEKQDTMEIALARSQCQKMYKLLIISEATLIFNDLVFKNKTCLQKDSDAVIFQRNALFVIINNTRNFVMVILDLTFVIECSEKIDFVIAYLISDRVSFHERK